ncbi:uncharacterized protein METZ01_LOCUS128790 [marine metagenome]|uniref:Uncharacterized protein n=1 Tax=marine metagenome TaxID=408172 RepID=A0A381YFN2_9ZZZZ
MDGVGYWLIIAAFYLLSSLMKQRKQKAARQALEQEDSIPGPEKEYSPPLLQNLFGDFWKMVEDSGREEKKTEDDFPVIESDEQMEHEMEPIIIEADSDKLEKSDFTYLPEKTQKLTYTGKNFWQKTTTVQNHFSAVLKNDLKTAFVLKEILDKPRAMRRTIR